MISSFSLGIFSVEIVLVLFHTNDSKLPTRHIFRVNSSDVISYQLFYVSPVVIFSVEIGLVPFIINDSRFP